MITRCYNELILLPTFEERFEYLRLRGKVGSATFGHDRYLNQLLYRDRRWRSFREQVIIRDNGCDLGIEEYELHGGIVVHHIVPLTPEDLEEGNPCIFDLNNVICTSPDTHKAIHYGDAALLPKKPIVRFPGDTRLW